MSPEIDRLGADNDVNLIFTLIANVSQVDYRPSTKLFDCTFRMINSSAQTNIKNVGELEML